MCAEIEVLGATSLLFARSRLLIFTLFERTHVEDCPSLPLNDRMSFFWYGPQSSLRQAKCFNSESLADSSNEGSVCPVRFVSNPIARLHK